MNELTNGRTPEEIKAGLRIHATWGQCKTCPYNEEKEVVAGHCIDRLTKDVYALIERIESERDAALEKVPNWISVKDELPPRERNILAVNGHGRIKILAFWKKEDKRWTWIEDSRFTRWNDITHWMPLPEPQEEV